MTGEDIPRFKVRALPPIGRREPGNTIPQLLRALSIMVFALAAVLSIIDARRGGPARNALAAMIIHRG